MSRPITYGDVCTGLSAASVAWGPLGWKPAWFAEVEAFPSAVLAHHYPNVPNMGDMTKLAYYVRQRLLAAPDILVGGTPCQAFSVAGLRGGLTDPRGQLTLAFVDLANAIDEQREPGDECVVYWENVPGALSDKTNAFGYLLAGLAGESEPLVAPGGKWPNAGIVIGPQRTIAWRVTDAQYFGVAQRRRRLFLVASARNGFDPGKLLFEFDGLRRDSAPRRETGQDAAGTLASRTDGGGFPGTDEACSGYVQPVAFGGNNQSGPIDVATARNACSSSSGRLDFESETFVVSASSVCPTLRAGGNSTGGDRPPGTDDDTADNLIAYAFQPRIARNGRGDMGDLVNALTAQAGETGKGDAAPCVAYRDAPIAFSAKDYGADATVDLAPTMRAMGHGESHANGGGQLAVCVTGSVTHALKAEGFDASEDGTGRGQPITPVLSFHVDAQPDQMRFDPHAAAALTCSQRAGVLQQLQYLWRVRRLTPRECERLQAFPDDYTRIPYRGKPAADGPRYKALGNSMCVYNMRWLGLRLIFTHPEFALR